MTNAVKRLILYTFQLLRGLNTSTWLPEVAEAYPLLLETWQHPQIARWFAYRRILSVGRLYRQILFADVRDVVFQAPFFNGSSEEKVLFFADADLYGEDNCNDTWYKEAYGKAALAKVIGQQPVCVGTVIASGQAIWSLLEAFTAAIERSPFGRIEQAIFNYMLYSNLFESKVEVAPNIIGAVATLASDAAHKSVKIINDDICRSSDGSLIPIVHMYDRWPDTGALCEDKYFKGCHALDQGWGDCSTEQN